MIEANNPEINVDELMQKIREEVARRKSSFPAKNGEVMAGAGTVVANYSNIVSCIDALLNNAEFKSQVRSHWPKKFERFPFNLSGGIQRFALKVYNFLLKEQRVVNSSLIEALRQSLFLNRQLLEQVTALQTQLQGTSAHLDTTDAHLQAVSDRISATDAQLQGVSDRLNTTDAQLQGVSDRLNGTDERVNLISDRISATDARVNLISDRISATDARLQEANDRLNATNGRLQGVSDHLNATDESYIRNDSYLKNDLNQQKRLIALFLEEARQRLPEPFSQEQVEAFVNEEQHLLDAFYVAFEEHFRGSREDILNRLKVYLPLVEQAKVGTQDSPILDVGCGRGEWLRLLQESEYVVRGLDINRVMLDECKARGFEVIEADVIDYLQALPDASLGAVTGFHIIEHLPFSALIQLFNETLRVLKPGGLAIFETPNPQNILVGTTNFYMDPTHRNPLPSPLVKFLVENSGFASVNIMNLNPYEESYKVSGSELAELFNQYFYGPQDYAVVGYKV
ncbi:methyltransferase domain-containing protein [Funiculus sociatus GB2-A5]|uniref:Methyltransferase domain-containing protein n=1 Tax=Funiculus sociatus GB2-A5 TaxID=2933946 RepID=A0ABV0JTG2_9CYAN|nr:MULTISPECIES: class I SAM-dependent methyltransferase [unclassified Trichocoleus]MBD1905966.1 methyltransferase domain-containing protein [Trichocoleus sp. FACHB-832]MBD2064837.1 methyltransferase domain-containing protein [Trichocoleus sp. FACHB-6]